MKTFTVLVAAFLAAALILSGMAGQSFAQGSRGTRATDNPVPARGAPAPHAGVPSAAGAGAAAGSASASGSGSAGSTAGGSYGGISGGGIPVLTGTSFTSIGNYYSWNDYYSYLCHNYNLSPLYFTRFYRNVEPLVTPEMLKLTLLRPIRLSSEMLNSIDALEVMLKNAESGKPADYSALREKSKKIRALAKQIRNNETLSHIDLRKEKELYKVDKENALSLEALGRMREMAVDIDRQLRELYRQPATSTVSVDSYSEPSLESLAKGIESICKSMESSSKRM
jgi:hypothetical protein